MPPPEQSPAAGGARARRDPYLAFDEIAQVLADHPAYRERQVRAWLARGITDPAQMTDLPLTLREQLADRLPSAPSTLRHVTADDGLTHKVLLGLTDAEAIESVLLCYPRGAPAPNGRPRRGRATVCISTQAGCAMGCPFCATGQAGLRRQLRTDEVVAQIVAVQGLLRDPALRAPGVPDHVTNVVFMGMGEPLANTDVTVATVRWLIDPDGFGLSARGVTVSTIGLVPGIRRLQQLQAPITLAVSLHAPTDELRDQLVPVNRQHPLSALLAACDAYVAATGRRMTFEYVLIDGVNADVTHARQLVALLSPRRAHVNLIPMNPTPAVAWVAPSVTAQRRFAAVLDDGGVTATIRHNRGTNIDAACGQLYANYQVASGRRLPAAERVLPLAAPAPVPGPGPGPGP
ncbi:23S rRNA (adenine(2503)-C(2))-methyltransferase RlmN [soil metagenome]